MRRLTEDERARAASCYTTARWMARRFGGSDVAYDGAMDGLMYAAARGSRPGITFRAYARHRIRGCILNAFARSSERPTLSLGRWDSQLARLDEWNARPGFEEEEVELVLSHLSARTREVVAMRMGGLSQDEIARRTGNEQKWVSRALVRAAEVLRPICERRGLL